MKNKEIKFRAWDLQLKQYRSVGTIQMSCSGTLFLLVPNGSGFDVEKIEDIILEQFTGLTDKNGKEIYDGDVLKVTIYEDEWITTVRDYYGTLIVDVEGCDWNTTALSFLDDESETEVIGNIYEHPNLLENGK